MFTFIISKNPLTQGGRFRLPLYYTLITYNYNPLGANYKNSSRSNRIISTSRRPISLFSILYSPSSDNKLLYDKLPCVRACGDSLVSASARIAYKKRKTGAVHRSPRNEMILSHKKTYCLYIYISLHTRNPHWNIHQDPRTASSIDRGPQWETRALAHFYYHKKSQRQRVIRNSKPRAIILPLSSLYKTHTHTCIHIRERAAALFFGADICLLFAGARSRFSASVHRLSHPHIPSYTHSVYALLPHYQSPYSRAGVRIYTHSRSHWKEALCRRAGGRYTVKGNNTRDTRARAPGCSRCSLSSLWLCASRARAALACRVFFFSLLSLSRAARRRRRPPRGVDCNAGNYWARIGRRGEGRIIYTERGVEGIYPCVLRGV